MRDRQQFLDSTLARSYLGWEPQVALKDGLSLAIDWYADYLGVPRRETIAAGGS